MKENKLIILFPGINYTVDCPLLYYAAFIYEARGCEIHTITYDKALTARGKYSECMEEYKQSVREKLKNIDFQLYDEVIFVSKSIGTVMAGWSEEELQLEVRHIYLTPLEETLPYIRKDKNISAVVAGTKDPFLDEKRLKVHCEKEKIKLLQIEAAGHRLEIPGDFEGTLRIIKEITALYE